MPATIQYLQLDSSYDPIFDPTANLTNLDAVTQAINTRLRLFLGEWWENVLLGLPVFQSILGGLDSPQGLAAMQLTIQQNIQGTPYVTSVTDVSLGFANGRLAIQYSATTSFGPVNATALGPAVSNATL